MAISVQRIWDRLHADAQVFVRFHLLPIAIWFALPKRLGYFLWYIGPNNGPNNGNRSRLDSALFYWNNALEDYFASPWLGYTAFAMLAVSAAIVLLAKQSRLWLLTIFTLVGFLLLVKHDNQKARFLHTWIPIVWIQAAMAIVVSMHTLQRCLSSLSLIIRSRQLPFSIIEPLHPNWSATKLVIRGGLAMTSLLIVGVAFRQIDGGHAKESQRYITSMGLAVSQEYLPWLKDSQQPAILGTLPIEYFAEWTYLSEYPQRARPWTTSQMRWISGDSQSTAENFELWVLEHHPDSIVLIDFDEQSPFQFPAFEHFKQISSLVKARTEYVCIAKERLSAAGCELTMWKLQEQKVAAKSPSEDKITR